jgi:tetratricopeptide (TPR) repeat protein
MATTLTDPIERLAAALGDRYVLVRELGRGGMAHVYLARDVHHGRDVAIKVLRTELATSIGAERFLREIQIEARLQHPNILPLHESGSAGDVLYYVMPYVEGETLKDRLRRERQLPVEVALRITGEICDALSYAHSQGVVHRDIKPANILLSHNHAIVADFGVARAVSAAGGEQLTESGLAIGTPEYMSPEQASGDSDVDGRSDLYALGCVLYEMLAGEPPFHGRTAQAVLARHRADSPPSVQVVRPNVPDGVQVAIEIALAKVAADRFTTADDFRGALDATGAVSTRRAATAHPPSKRRAVAGALGAVALLAGVAIWQWTGPLARGLDPNRVVVFPLRETGLVGTDKGAGENVATYIGYALEGTRPLTWLDGWDFLDASQRADVGRLTPMAAAEISRARRARYYIDGSIVNGRDTVTVVLRLHDVQGDSLRKTSGASEPAAGTSLPQLGLRAVGDLLPALLSPGRRVDVSALSDRNPAAIANFLQGEREYRRMRFGQALEYYRSAVRADSAFALAALKGAEAANWPQLSTEDEQLVNVALARETLLPYRHAVFARGLRDYFAGSADSAVRHFREAIGLDSTWSEAWMALGEVYYHLLPMAAPLDSLAADAFERSRRADSTFTPPLLHLAEMALRRGDLAAADRLIAQVRRADPDSTLGNQLVLMSKCVRDGPGAVDWRQATRREAQEVVAVGKLLAVGGANPGCAQAAFRALLEADSTGPGERWAALVGLQSLLIASQRPQEVPQLLKSKGASDLPGSMLLLLDAGAGPGLDSEAETAAKSLGQDYRRLDAPLLWLLGTWEASQGKTERLAAIVAALGTKRDSSSSRRDSLMVRALESRLVLLRGDSTEALRRLTLLRPTAPSRDLEWQHWESLGGERILQAELLLSQRRFGEAMDVAAQIDSPQPLVYLLYLRPSLLLRERAAKGLGKSSLAAFYHARAQKLTLPGPAVTIQTTKPHGGAT